MDHFTKTTYNLLLGSCKFFLDSGYVSEAIHCLCATLNIKDLCDSDKARCELNLGNLILAHTNNLEVAKIYFYQAYSRSTSQPQCTEVLFQSVSKLASLCPTGSEIYLYHALDMSQKSSHHRWHYELTFQLAGLHFRNRDLALSVGVLSLYGFSYAQSNNHHYIALLFKLTICLVFLSNDASKFEDEIMEVGPLIEEYSSDVRNLPRCRESLNVFWRFLKVYHLLSLGRPKTAKKELRMLQKSMIALATLLNLDSFTRWSEPESFLWMSRDHLCILVYLVTTMHSLHEGLVCKATKYISKALTAIRKLKSVGDRSHLNAIFEASVLEHAAMCKMIQGNGAGAIEDIGEIRRICIVHDELWIRMKPVVHCLLGMYAMSMNMMDKAELHLDRSICILNKKSENGRIAKNLYYMSILSLAIIHVRKGAEETDHFRRLIEKSGRHIESMPVNLYSSYYYILGLKEFFDTNYEIAKTYLCESISCANQEDIRRVGLCSLVLLSNVLLEMSHVDEALAMVIPAMTIASKMGDMYVKLWSSLVLRKISGKIKHEDDAKLQHTIITTHLLQDHLLAEQKEEHSLLLSG